MGNNLTCKLRRSASLNPELPDDVFTGYNAVYNNIISDSDDGIRATRSQSNTLENITLCNVSSNEDSLAGNSSMTIKAQDIDIALMAVEGSATNNLEEIVDSGIIQMIEINDDGDDDDHEGNNYNTDNEPYRK